MNTKEWIEPEKFIPDRFDPTSNYYLTPSGGKRHPMSFGPFLGGKRICLGKTMAEYSGKVVISIICSQLQFEFSDPIHNTKKPLNIFGKEFPTYAMKVRLAK